MCDYLVDWQVRLGSRKYWGTSEWVSTPTSARKPRQIRNCKLDAVVDGILIGGLFKVALLLVKISLDNACWVGENFFYKWQHGCFWASLGIEPTVYYAIFAT